MEHLPTDGFWWNLIFELRSKIYRENSSFNKILQEYRVFYIKTFSYLWQYLAKLFLKWIMFYKNVVDKIKTHILISITFYWKSHRLWDNVEKYDGDRGATNDFTIWRIRVACWISKATCTYAHAHAHAAGHEHARAHTHTILIDFPR